MRYNGAFHLIDCSFIILNVLILSTRDLFASNLIFPYQGFYGCLNSVMYYQFYHLVNGVEQEIRFLDMVPCFHILLGYCFPHASFLKGCKISAVISGSFQLFSDGIQLFAWQFVQLLLSLLDAFLHFCPVPDTHSCENLFLQFLMPTMLLWFSFSVL